MFLIQPGPIQHCTRRFFHTSFYALNFPKRSFQMKSAPAYQNCKTRSAGRPAIRVEYRPRDDIVMSLSRQNWPRSSVRTPTPSEVSPAAANPAPRTRYHCRITIFSPTPPRITYMRKAFLLFP